MYTNKIVYSCEKNRSLSKLKGKYSGRKTWEFLILLCEEGFLQLTEGKDIWPVTQLA